MWSSDLGVGTKPATTFVFSVLETCRLAMRRKEFGFIKK